MDLSLANKSPKPTLELVAIACDLDDPQLSRQKRATLFLKFFSFCKNKILFKNAWNTQKSFCVWINKNWVCKNTFYQVQSHKWIWHSLNINLCVVCRYQQWDSPQSNVKLQWSIQPRHTQLVLDHVTYLNNRSMHIWPPTWLDNITWSFTFDSIFQS